MKVVSSLKTLKSRDRHCQVVRRRGRLYVINKKNPRLKARQGEGFAWHMCRQLIQGFYNIQGTVGFPAVSFARISDCVTLGCSASWQVGALRGGVSK